MAFADIDEVDPHLILIRTEYRDRDLIRAVPGATYKPDKHGWVCTLTWASCLTLRGLFRDRLELGPSLVEWASEHVRAYVKPAMAMRELTDAPATWLTERLYPFQRAGVDFLTHARRALLTDEMGTGKTTQTIHTLKSFMYQFDDPFPALVVAPNNVKGTWEREWEQWWPEVKVEMLDGGRGSRLKQIEKVGSGESQVLIANWEALRGHSRLAPYGSIRLRHCHNCDRSLRDDPERHPMSKCERCPRELNEITWASIIGDEIHRAKDAKAKQTRALWALRTPGSKFLYGLSGTPIADTPQDLWSALHFIDPASWPSKSAYIDRWCLQSFNPFGGMTVVGLKPETREEFFAITDPHVRRMPKALVLSQLPPKVYSTRYVDMSPKQAKAYKSMQDNMLSMLRDDDQPLVAVNPLTQLLRLMQFSSAYAEIGDDNDVRLTDPSCKIDALLEILDELGSKPVVVFAQSRQLIDLASARLEKLGVVHGLIVGGQTAAERQAQIEAFQANRMRAMLATVGAGGIGITLTRSDTVVFLQRSWSAVENIQAEDRCHRIGADTMGHESIAIIDVVAKATVEEGQRMALGAKGERMEEITRDRQLVARLLEGEAV